MQLNHRILGVSLGVLVALTAAGAPPGIVVASRDIGADARYPSSYVSPLLQAGSVPAASPAGPPAADAFQPAEWRPAAGAADGAGEDDGAAAADRPAETTTAPATAREPAPVSARELECLARAVYYEARGEPLHGQAAVAHVILNRTRSGRFPASVCGVVDQPGQFTFRAGRPERRHPAQWARAQKLAAQALAGELPNPVGSALFFHADHVSPGWRRPRVAEIGNHIFYR